MNRAYSVFEIKSYDEDQRIIAGIATSPKTDRMGDVIEPRGAEYKLPLPLLWQHNSREPIGHVTSAEVTDDGINVTARLLKIDEPGKLKDRLDEAWQSIKHGLVRGFSIGFRPTEEPEWIKGTQGLRFGRWEWLELSAVTVPANACCDIMTVKQYDDEARAASGTERPSSPSPASGQRVVHLTEPPKAKDTMTATERIAALEAKRAANVARMNELENKATAESRSKDAAEQEEFDTLDAEIETIGKALVDAHKLEKLNASQAKPVNGGTQKEATDSRNPSRVVVVHEKAEPGIRFARFAMAMIAAKGDTQMALNLMQTHYPNDVQAIGVIKAARDRGTAVHKMISEMGEWRTKAAVPAGDTQDATWASPLVAYNDFAGDFIEYLRPRTIIGQFGQNGAPELRSVPFNVHIKGQTSGGTGYWVGEGAPKPVTAFDFNDTYHPWGKVAAISVLTEELIRFSNPSAERLVREALSGTVIERMDSDLVDPTITAVANVRPASLTNGLTPITASGTTAADFRTDWAALFAAAITARLPIRNAVIITDTATAMSLSLMQNALGQREFPEITMNGGRLNGVPAIVSDYVDAGDIILVFASEVSLSDDGVVTIDASNQASLQMLDNPTNSPVGSTVATSHVSLWQTNSVGFRAERFIWWSKRRATAVAYITGAAYA